MKIVFFSVLSQKHQCVYVAQFSVAWIRLLRTTLAQHSGALFVRSAVKAFSFRMFPFWFHVPKSAAQQQDSGDVGGFFTSLSSRIRPVMLFSVYIWIAELHKTT